ncbi:MAG: NUDIX hydrolase [Ignisphaera sp.]|uniref:NUDIX domain-containing protein n=1 Tax=Ignisphaera aggregans TaxID=334771 RepID=A0A7J3MZE7_9CREN
MSSRVRPLYAITAVGAVVLRNNNVLIVKRGFNPGKGLWSIPGGVVEAGENIYEAARRELNEETGIDAKPLGVLLIINNIVRDSTSRIVYHYLILDVLFDEKSVKGSPRPGGDAIDVAFIPIDEVVKRSDVTRSTKYLVNLLAKENGNRLQLLDVYELDVFD